ncbi:MAG: FAD-dependent oxidoreductase [Candidatus Korobacteraceae bacterium]
MELIGAYDVVVAGAGIAGVVAALRSAREGAWTMLLEAIGFLGGLVTGGRQSRPAGSFANCWIAVSPTRVLTLFSYSGAPTQGHYDAETMERGS